MLTHTTLAAMDWLPHLKILLTITAVLASVYFYRRVRQIRSQNRQQTRYQNQRLLNSVLADLGDACLLVQRDGTILFANEGAEALLGASKLKGRRLSQVFPQDAITKFILRGFEIEERSTQEDFEIEMHPQGRREERFLIVNVAPVSFLSDEEKLVRVVISDETRRREIEQIRRDFVANASHELRTPLAIINGYLENLLDGTIDDPVGVQKALQIMQKHGDRLARLVEDMLMISKFESAEEAGASHLREQQFSCRECVEGVLDRLAPMFEEKQARHQLSMPAKDTISGDRHYWDQIFFNLIENALKENQADGRLVISITLEEKPTHQEICVKDNGVGIPHEHLPFVFKRFYRVAKDHSQQKVKGTGLGLSIVSRAVQAHGGTIEVESSPGLLTQFCIKLPL